MRIFGRLVLLLTAFFCLNSKSFAVEGGELLWWMITDVNEITGIDKDNNIHKATDLGVNSARIRYESSSGESGYLTLWGLDENGVPFKELDSISGVGLPAEYYGSLATLAGDSASYSFVMELGNWENGKWTQTTMLSERVSYTDLVADKHIATWDDLTPVDSFAWSPQQYHVVPEPNSVLMVIIGCAMLALRRRRV